jgi:hypothetical protein
MKTKNKNTGWLLMPLAVTAVFLLSVVLGGLGYLEFMPPERTCVSCHEIRASHARWTNSVHRNVSCKACHGGSADSIHALRENAKRVFSHLTKPRHDDIRLSEDQIIRMTRACQSCHEREFAHWSQGGHGTNYARIFMDPAHNGIEQMADDCLRCHGMFFEGNMSELAAPLDVKGPWRFKNPAMAGRPAIPCLACHQMPAPGEPFSRSRSEREEESKRETNAPAFRRDAIAFYVRQEKAHIAIDDLMTPKIVHGGRSVKVSDDPRQRLCTQCHAPDAFGNAGSSDDRTPRGVHEGLSCAACHAPHSNNTRISCALCHPRFSIADWMWRPWTPPSGRAPANTTSTR